MVADVGILLIVQGCVAVVFLKVLANRVSFIILEPLTPERVKQWMPVTVMFAFMIFTGSQTLVYLTIPIVTVFKNMTNLMIAYGDWAWFHQSISWGVIGSFLMMTLGSVLSGFTDLQFDLTGYMWMAANCMSQAGYVLYMRKAQKQTKLSEWGSAYYNNLLSIPVLAVMCVVNGEVTTVFDYPLLWESSFMLAVVFSGIIGTALSLSVFWVVNVTSPTTYSMIGALNKIPITFVSVLIFHTVLTGKAVFSLTVGLASGVVYTYAKYLETLEKQKKASIPLERIEFK